MRILYVHLYNRQFKDMGGADKGVFDLARGMADEHHEQVMCLTNRGRLYDELSNHNLMVSAIPNQKFAFLNLVAKLNHACKTFRPDIIHSHHRYSTFILDLLFKKRDAVILHTQRIESWTKRALFRYGHYATTVSAALCEQLQRQYAVPKDRIKTIMNAVSYSEPNSTVLDQLQVKHPDLEGKVIILCVGRFDEQKGHRYLVQAVSELSEEVKAKICVCLVGSGPLENDLRRQIKAYRLSEQFRFIGFTEDVSEWLAMSKFLVLPSLWEGLPRVVLESFFAGRPVIATNINGTREVVSHGENGMLVPPKDVKALSETIKRFVENPEDVENMGQQALLESKKYTVSRMLGEYHQLYRELIEKKLKGKI